MRTLAIYSPESILHTFIHFFAVVGMFWVLIYLPLWISFLAMIMWLLQFKLVGRCIFTQFAHSRGVMVGMTYWEYVAHLLHIKNAKKAGYIIDTFLKIMIVLILLFRLYIQTFI